MFSNTKSTYYDKLYDMFTILDKETEKIFYSPFPVTDAVLRQWEEDHAKLQQRQAQVMRRLASDFITPINREDIAKLCYAVVDLSQALHEVIAAAARYRLGKKLLDTNALFTFAAQYIAIFKKESLALFDKKRPAEESEAVQTLQKNYRCFWRQQRAALYRQCQTALEVAVWNDICGGIENFFTQLWQYFTSLQIIRLKNL